MELIASFLSTIKTINHQSPSPVLLAQQIIQSLLTFCIWPRNRNSYRAAIWKFHSKPNQPTFKYVLETKSVSSEDAYSVRNIYTQERINMKHYHFPDSSVCGVQ